MTLTTYTHVIRELRGTATVPIEQQIRQAREDASRTSAEAGGDSRVSSVCPEGAEAER